MRAWPASQTGLLATPGRIGQGHDSDGYLRTGDVAIMDEQGFFKIVDRMKDMILVSGFNVYPNEIEEVVMMHADVMEVAAVAEVDAHCR